MCLCCAEGGFKDYESDEGFAQGFERTSQARVCHSEWMWTGCEEAPSENFSDVSNVLVSHSQAFD